MARFRLRLSRRVSDLARPRSQTEKELAALPPDDQPPEDEDLKYGCTGCLWAGMAFIGVLGLSLVLNRCVRG